MAYYFAARADALMVVVAFVAMIGSFMVSYTRARAEGLGVKCEVGVMQRAERVVYLGVLSVFNFLGNFIAEALGYGPGDYLLKLALILMLVFSSYTAVQRMFHVMTELKKREDKKKIEPGTVP